MKKYQNITHQNLKEADFLDSLYHTTSHKISPILKMLQNRQTAHAQ